MLHQEMCKHAAGRIPQEDFRTHALIQREDEREVGAVNVWL